MLTDIIVWIFSFFVIGPIEGHLNEAMLNANAAPAIVQEARACVEKSGPALADRAWNDPWWGISTVATVAVGYTTPETAIRDALPGCAAILDKVIAVKATTET